MARIRASPYRAKRVPPSSLRESFRQPVYTRSMKPRRAKARVYGASARRQANLDKSIQAPHPQFFAPVLSHQLHEQSKCTVTEYQIMSSSSWRRVWLAGEPQPPHTTRRASRRTRPYLSRLRRSRLGREHRRSRHLLVFWFLTTIGWCGRGRSKSPCSRASSSETVRKPGSPRPSKAFGGARSGT